MTSAPQCNISTPGFKETKLSLSHFKIFFFLADFLFLRAFLNEAQENRKRLKKTVQRKNILIERTSLWAEKKKNQTNRGWLER